MKHLRILFVFAAFFLLVATSVQAAEKLPVSLIPVQEKLFAKAFEGFLKDLRTAHPELKLPETMKAPAFDPSWSRNQWLDVFVEYAIRASEAPASEIEKFDTKSKEMFTSYSRDVGYARLYYLEDQTAKYAKLPPSPVKSVQNLPLPKAYPANHTLNLNDYVSERFPVVLQNFVKDLKIPLYVEETGCEDAVVAQKQEGFNRAIRYMSPRDNWMSPYFFAYNSNSGKYRFVVCDIFGLDQRTRFVAILGPVFYGNGAKLVTHQKRSPLVTLNRKGLEMRVDEQRDLAVLGFQNTVWWELWTSSKSWERIPLTDVGPDISLFRNRDTGLQIVGTENPYGDVMTEAMQILYTMGFRRFVYLGTSGGLSPQVSIGDVVLPSRFQDGRGGSFTFDNQASATELTLEAGAKIHRDTYQGWVPTLIAETKDVMLKMRDDGVHALDVESRYFAKFCQDHPEIREHKIVISVSDTPMGHISYDQENALRAIPMKSIRKFVPKLLGAVAKKSKRAVASVKKKKPEAENPWPHDFFEKEY